MNDTVSKNALFHKREKIVVKCEYLLLKNSIEIRITNNHEAVSQILFLDKKKSVEFSPILFNVNPLLISPEEEM